MVPATEGEAEGTGGCMPTSAKGSVAVGSGSEGQVSSQRKGKTQECPVELLLYQPASPLCRAAQVKWEKDTAPHGKPSLSSGEKMANMIIPS